MNTNLNMRVDERGFTLVELLVGMAVALLLIGAATTAFIMQNRAASVQQGTSDMQLSGQVAMEFIERDTRMSGFGIDRSAVTNAIDTAYHSFGGAYVPVRAANTGCLFVNYTITPGTPTPYFYYIEPPGTNGREGGLTRLNTATDAVETIASNVEDLQVTITPEAGTALPIARISLLMRSPYFDPSFYGNHPGITAADHPGIGATVNPPADNFRRRVVTATARSRNIGL